jgi:general secretion pathway protein B
LNDLQAQGVLQLPEMHLDIHVFSGQAAERFVFVNMKKYTEGATLSEGPAVQEITQEGVVLDYLGTRFLLPRE